MIHGRARPGRAGRGLAGRDKAGPGVARQGLARHGSARHGKGFETKGNYEVTLQTRDALVAQVDQAQRAPLPSLRQASDQTRRCRGDKMTLTPCELDVAKLIADGMTSKQIAGSLGKSIYTIHAHIRNAMEKTGSRTRSQLAVIVTKGAA